jgi:uncharacterized membrane protein (DUF2068 family)
LTQRLELAIGVAPRFRQQRIGYDEVVPMKSSNTRLIRLIALFKLLKAILLIAVGVAAFKLIHTDITDALIESVARLGLDPGGRYVGRAILKTATLTPDKIKDVGVGSFIYAGLFLTEGIGLWLVKRWAEWFSVIITSSLVPLEVYEIHRHPTTLKVLALLINLAVVGYLLYRIRDERSEVRCAELAATCSR